MLPRKTKTVLEKLGGPAAEIGDPFVRTGKAVYQNKHFIIVGRKRLWWAAIRFSFRRGFDFCHGNFGQTQNGAPFLADNRMYEEHG